MQEVDKINFKINFLPNRLEYMSFNINIKLVLLDSFQFLSSSLDSLVKKLNKDDIKYLSQEFDSSVVNPVKQKKIYPDVYTSGLKSLKKNYQAKKSFIVHWPVKKLVIKNMNMFLRFGLNFK